MTPNFTFRSMLRDDVPEFAKLRLTCFERTKYNEPRLLEEQFRSIFFDNPWRALNVAPTIAEAGGRIAGIAGAMPRLLSFKGRRITQAALMQFMVHPDFGGMGLGSALYREQFRGDHDLAWGDASNLGSVKAVLPAGGETCLLNSCYWYRMIRPSAQLPAVTRPHENVLRNALFAPLRGAMDGFGRHVRTPNFLRAQTPKLKLRRLKDTEFGHLQNSLAPEFVLTAHYDDESARWVLQRLRMLPYGKLRAYVTENRDGEAVGWFIYFARRHGFSDVVQYYARAGYERAVLHALFRDAWFAGVAQLRGRTTPSSLHDLSEVGAHFRRAGPWAIMHTYNSELRDVIRMGNAAFSRLDGEWLLGI